MKSKWRLVFDAASPEELSVVGRMIDALHNEDPQLIHTSSEYLEITHEHHAVLSGRRNRAILEARREERG